MEVAHSAPMRPPWQSCPCPNYLHINSYSSSPKTSSTLALETRPGYTSTHLSVTNFLCLNPSCYKTSHHKQDSLRTTSKIFYFLLQIYIVKPYRLHLQSTWNYEFQTHPTPLLLAAWIRSKESLSISAATQVFLNPFCFFAPLINIRNKQMKSWTHLATSTLG